MPILRLKEIRSMSTEQRATKLLELKTELVRLKTMISAGGAVENPARIRQLRKTIARILTIENEQKQHNEKTKETESKKEKNKK
ncbi:MAG: 50S ribosomal protein L29 [Candidatus Bathyarchaeia archaeon]